MRRISLVKCLPWIGILSLGGHVVLGTSVTWPKDLSSSPNGPTTTPRRSAQHNTVLWGPYRSIVNDSTTNPIILTLRGGAKNGTKKSQPASQKTKKNSNKSKNKKTKKTEQDREKISEALHKKDAAKAMGDAIRERADQWRQSPFLDSIDTSLTSVGLAMGAADQSSRFLDEDTTTTPAAAAGGVDAATTSVVVHYFLKSHGGAHAVQSVCSLLAAVSGLGAIFLPPTFTIALLRRCMLFAMTKHLAGILAACVLTARALPEMGLSEARQRMEDLVQDPVAQYVFYAACLLVWLPTKMAPDAPPLWWQQFPIAPVLFTGPILLREIVSTIFVFSDVLLLWVYSNQQAQGPAPFVGFIRIGQCVINALMSILVTPKVWRPADALQRQVILARLVSRASLAMEVLVGLVLVGDALLLAASLGLGKKRPSFASVIKALVCARLYVNFLWTRRRRIRKLATKIRGGASGLPLYVLNVMLDPWEAMGLRDSQGESLLADSAPKREANQASWRTYLRLATGVDED